jgi:23S rRNA pseudouridine2605 synthase
MSEETLLKLLTGAGVGSRRRLTDAIKEGRVTVNGNIVENFRLPVNTKTDLITLDGKLVDIKTDKPVYLLLNKPAGVLSTTDDERGRKTVLDLLPTKYRNLRLYPVGRLDKDSTGLLLLTNDGELTYRLTHPRFEHEKEYLVGIEGKLKFGEIKQLERGINIGGSRTHRAVLKEIKDLSQFQYSLTIHEGKKRQVRLMFAALGYHVLVLKRVRMGRLTLGNLKEGQVKELNPEQARKLFIT